MKRTLDDCEEMWKVKKISTNSSLKQSQKKSFAKPTKPVQRRENRAELKVTKKKKKKPAKTYHQINFFFFSQIVCCIT